MHHYDATLTLLKSESGGKQEPIRSGYRCMVEVAGLNFDGVLAIDALEVLPGGAAHVRLTFDHPELACPLVNEDTDYRILEGPRTVGALRILSDAWQKIDDIVPLGAVLTATVDRIDWTRAALRLPGGATSSIRSAQVGLRPWAEIGDRVQVGTELRVRVTNIDKVCRVIEVVPADRPSGAGA
jgi:hypothetical protein